MGRDWASVSLIVLLWTSAGATQAAEPAAVAAATNARTGAAQLDEIIVTAQRRTERLQDVPVSVSVVTATDLSQADIGSVRDLGKIVPNLAITQAAGVESILAIRGIGNNRATQTARAAMIIDDVPYVEQLSLNAGNLFDVEQIEVLRGPQSTLYGLTAEAGLIVVRTRGPSSELHMDASGDLTSGGDYGFGGALSGPVLGDRLMARIGAAYAENRGTIDNVLTRSAYDPEVRWSVRLQALLRPFDDVEIDLTYAHNQVRNDAGVAYTPLDRAAYNRDFQVAVGELETAADHAGFAKTNADEGSIRGRWSLGGATLLSVTAYRDFEGATQLDIDQTPQPFLGLFKYATNTFSNSVFTQEFRASSPDDSRLKWTGGLFYYQRRKAVGTTVTSPGGQTRGFGTETRQRFESRSVFGQVTTPLAGGLSLTAGTRYEAIEDVGVQDINFTNPAANGSRARLKDEIWLPKVILNYKASDDLLIYASVGRGWLPGGVNPASGSAAQFTYGSEVSWSAEAGIKGTFLDKRLRVNADVYRMDTEGYQELVRITPITAIVSNVRKVRTEGLEIDFAAQIRPNLRVRGGVGVNHARYIDFVDASGSKNGKQLPINPKVNASLGVTWEPTERLSLHSEWSYSGKFYESTDSAHVFGPQAGHNIVNLSGSYRMGEAVATVFVNNVGDERYFTYVQNVINNGRLFGNPGEPREVGVKLTWSLR